MGSKLPIFDARWVDTTTQEAAIKLENLQKNLRNSKMNSEKESIRRGNNEIGDHLVNCGNLIEAITAYNKTRDYCTNPCHIMEMCLRIIHVCKQ